MIATAFATERDSLPAVEAVAVSRGVWPSRAEIPFAVDVAAETFRGVAGVGLAAGSPTAPDLVAPDPVDNAILAVEDAKAAPWLTSSAPWGTRTAAVTAITDNRAATAT